MTDTPTKPVTPNAASLPPGIRLYTKMADGKVAMTNASPTLADIFEHDPYPFEKKWSDGFDLRQQARK